VISGYNRMILDELSTLDPLRGFAEEILKAADRAAALTQQLLAFSRRQVVQPRVIGVNSVIAQTEKMLRRLIGEDVELSSSRGANLWHTLADPSQFEQILVNLVVNARDAMPDGGRLSIETLNVELDELGAGLVGAPKPGDYVVLRVSDDGVGMDEATRERVFEPFFTTKPVGKGTGLGLSTVYGVARQSEGGVAVNSQLGVGTTISVYLPRVEGDVLHEERPRHVAPTGTETILLCEDAPQVRDLAAQMLRRQGYGVVVAESPQHALELATENAFGLLVTDVVMPGMSGRELVRRLEEGGQRLPVLYSSGYSSTVIGEDDLVGAGRGFLQKPYSLYSLASAVREVLDQSGLTLAA